MKIGLTLNDKFIGLEPGTDKVYSDRLSQNSWEDIELTRHDDGHYDALFIAAQKQFTITPNGEFQVRNKGTYGDWEKLDLYSDGTLGRVGIKLKIHGSVSQPSSISKLHIDGYDFKNEQNEVVKIKGFSSFAGFYNFLEGNLDLHNHYDEFKSLGGIHPRIFLSWMLGGIQFNPNKYGNIMNHLNDFAGAMNEKGFLPQFTIVCDGPSWAIDLKETIRYANDCCEVLSGHVCIVEFCNEYFKNLFHSGDQFQVPKPPNFSQPICFSSFLQDYEKDIPIWDYASIHGRRDGEGRWPKWLTDIPASTAVYEGWSGFSGSKKPTIHGEPRGFAEQNQDNRRSNEPYKARQLGFNATSFLNGVIFHSDDGMFCRPLGGVTRRCAEEFFKGCNSAE